MTNGKSFNFFFIDGSINGLIQCTNKNWKGVAYKIPRTGIEKYKEREDLKNTGIYFLFGNDEEDNPVIYIGQARERKNGEGILYRLREHIRDKKKDFWREAIIFTFNDNSLGPTEICYLENIFCSLAINAKRYIVKNGNDPSIGNPSEAEKCELDEFIEYAKFITVMFGYKVFEQIEDSEITFLIKLKSENDTKAYGKLTSEGFVVLQNSHINSNLSDSLSSGYKGLRDKYAFQIDNESKLKNDILFNSPSAASSFVLGRNSNGRVDWKTKDGKTIETIESEVIK